MKWSHLTIIGLTAIGNAQPLTNPYSKWSQAASIQGLVVDLGYGRFEGQQDSSLNAWLGLRYAASTAGNMRFQAPQVPDANDTRTTSTTDWQVQCIQGSGSGSEDCLFLNVHAPQNASDLPVFVFIHGGGYNQGSAAFNPTGFINDNNNRFVTVFIQYRLGVFGFLSSEEVKKRGQLNAGLLDMELALQWVQNYIHLFGGDPRRVTIGGESAGAGAVMLLSLLCGGHLGESLFTSVIGASPYLPKQFNYDDDVAQSAYAYVASQTGCTGAQSVFDCLVQANATMLSTAGQSLGNSRTYTSWGFVPVTDGMILQQLPSQQLRRKQVNGKRILIGNNANEAQPWFTPKGIVTSADFENFFREVFPLFSDSDFSKLKEVYPSSGDTNPHMTNYSTLGYTGPTALTMSGWANGEQQRVNNLQAEVLFVCPAYWLAAAFPEAWKYEFSVPPGLHGYDMGAYFYRNGDWPAEFVIAFENIWGNFIVHGDPRISQSLACGTNCDPRTADMTLWKPWNGEHSVQLSANMTGGTLAFYNATSTLVPSIAEPGLSNSYTLSDSVTWEGGRGNRCRFWQEMGPKIPQ
ncbi:hypothetical protein OIDMADRAFT_167121 [Oidiodendron maius Zn]|uniref:Carboxylic ester hydrolase n=1 Tax=Oidiodendron maius (strain Zn) TaxID=913774 RepID=A0A0C3H787_OIDMZ|nr:hypothetical protein OIDMADRAFT_167121 [Oidiodendron maius Zn]